MSASNRLPDYRYRVQVVRVIDGDTLECDVDLGFHTRTRVRLRLLGVNCPEMDTAEGRLAKQFVEGLVSAAPAGWLAKTVKADKYGGRWDAAVYLPDGRVLNDLLLESGHAVPYPAK